MEPTSTTPSSPPTVQLAQLNLQSPSTPSATNGQQQQQPQTTMPPPRTGIPRYAIAYRRPDRPATSLGTRSSGGPTSPAASEGQPVLSRLPGVRVGGRNGVRTESVGDECIGRVAAQPRYNRAASVADVPDSPDPLRGDSESEHSSAFSSSGQPRRITSKIGSLQNASHRPGGGNVTIYDEKIDFSHAHSKCNSKANLKHKPGGGDVQIVDNKLTFKDESRSRVGSLANAKHIAGGGNVKIETQKLDFKENATSKVSSLKNVTHNAGGGNVQIFNEKLPWLKYNKPNLAPEEKAKINKHIGVKNDKGLHSSGHSSTVS